MKKKYYVDMLSGHHQLPIGMSSYLSVILEEYVFKSQSQLPQDLAHTICLPCIFQGLAMLTMTNIKTKEIAVLEFFAEGDFLPAILQSSMAKDYSLKIEFLEETTLLGISGKHFTFLPKIFKESTLLYQNIDIKSYSDQIRRETFLNITPKKQRLIIFNEQRPKFIGRIEYDHIASYLRIS